MKHETLHTSLGSYHLLSMKVADQCVKWGVFCFSPIPNLTLSNQHRNYTTVHKKWKGHLIPAACVPLRLNERNNLWDFEMENGVSWTQRVEFTSQYRPDDLPCVSDSEILSCGQESVFLGRRLDWKTMRLEIHQSAVQLDDYTLRMYQDFVWERGWSPQFLSKPPLRPAFKSERERRGRNSKGIVLDSFVANFPQFQLFMFAFIPDMDILCLGAPAFLLGAAGLYNRLAGLFFPFLMRKEKKRGSFFFFFFFF